MGAGRKTECIRLLKPTTGPDGQGGQTVTWTAVGPTALAEIDTPGASETLTATQIVANVRRMVTIWYASDWAAALPTWRIGWGDQTLHIHGIEDVGQRHRELRFTCTEVQGAA